VRRPATPRHADELCFFEAYFDDELTAANQTDAEHEAERLADELAADARHEAAQDRADWESDHV
jgi:hypothetical protein